MDESELAMAGMARAQAAIRAIANGDDVEVLRIINEASEGESRWMAGNLLSALSETFDAFTKHDAAQTKHLLLLAAEGMNEDIAETGAAVAVEEMFRREGW